MFCYSIDNSFNICTIGLMVSWEWLFIVTPDLIDPVYRVSWNENLIPHHLKALFTDLQGE